MESATTEFFPRWKGYRSRTRRARNRESVHNEKPDWLKMIANQRTNEYTYYNPPPRDRPGPQAWSIVSSTHSNGIAQTGWTLQRRARSRNNVWWPLALLSWSKYPDAAAMVCRASVSGLEGSHNGAAANLGGRAFLARCNCIDSSANSVIRGTWVKGERRDSRDSFGG